MNFFSFIFQKKIIFFIIILIAIPFCFFLISQTNKRQQKPANNITVVQQENQSVTNKQAILYFTLSGSTTPLTKFSAPSGTTVVLDLYTDVKTASLNGFDIVLQPQNSLELQKISDGTDAPKFTSSILNNIKQQRLTKVVIGNTVITGKLHLATFTFLAQIKGKGNLKIKYAALISLQNKNPLSVNLPVVSYVIY